MGKALYRKYRSKSLAEIIGQEHITETLGNALKQGTISHAYLFTGPRGTGKTSIARILAHEVNQLSYSEQTHLDIIEIDAASNRRIDEIRELRERVHVAPTSAKYKVYIIDEVHMLTKEAFNALLKTLEEPPEHVIFILATTEAHKVPETIISRTQRFTFKPVSIDKVAKHLRSIAQAESIQIDENALMLIASHGEGSFRDSISLLDQIRYFSEHITLSDVQQAIGQAPDNLLADLINRISTGNLADIATDLSQLQEQGIQAPQVARQLSRSLREDVLKQQPALPVQHSLQLLQDLSSVGATQDPGLALELAIYSVALLQNPTLPVQADTKPPKAETKPHTPDRTSQEKPQKQPSPLKDQGSSEPGLNNDSWQKVLAAIKAKHNTLYGIARMGVPQFGTNKLTLSFAFAFHQKRLDDSKNKQLLIQIIREVTGNQVTLVCVVDKHAQASPPEPLEPPNEPASEEPVDLEAISNIFGSAEVVE